jgi:hypothetical protein
MLAVCLYARSQVTVDRWWQFCDELKDTHVTHMYLSEHVVEGDLKNDMRAVIRANRSKHERHRSYDNLAVIERCTNMWWNPINAQKLQVCVLCILQFTLYMCGSTYLACFRAESSDALSSDVMRSDVQF